MFYHDGLPPLPPREAANHGAMAIVATLDAFKTLHQPHVIENVVTERTFYIQVPALAPIPISAQGELSKAVAQTRAAKAAASEQTRSEASWAR